jgi:hypothetical protein
VASLKWVNERLVDYKPLLYTGEITSTKGRDAVVQTFKEDSESRALLLSLKAGGVGLNLPWANYVVHFDSWWNPAVAAQAEDRAHRIGQEKTVFVTTLVSEDTIEERIEELLAKKRQLFNSVIDDLSDAGLKRVLSEEELFGLFDLKPRRAASAKAAEPVPVERISRVFRGESPFSNVIILRSLLEECKDHIWWADMHFRRRALVELLEAINGGQINEIKILSGDAVVKDDARSKDDFKRFKQEVKALGVVAEWRVARGRFAHDRYIIGSNICYNVPPVGTIFAGDYGEALETPSVPPFGDWWAEAVPIDSFQAQ